MWCFRTLEGFHSLFPFDIASSVAFSRNMSTRTGPRDVLE